MKKCGIDPAIAPFARLVNLVRKSAHYACWSRVN
jgi:hypothetical protein